MLHLERKWKEVISKFCCYPEEKYTEKFQSYLAHSHIQEIPKDFLQRKLYEVGNLSQLN